MTHVIDETGGRTVVLHPPYYSNLNPAKLIWSQVECYVARNIASFRVREIRCLVETAVQNTVAEKWPHCVQRAVRGGDLLWELDGPTDSHV